MAVGHRRAAIAVTATCVVAGGCFAGAVSERALFEFVVPGAILAGSLAALLVPRFSALLASLAVSLGWAVLANTATGISNGPAARSTMAVAALTSLAVVTSATRTPALFLLPVGGIVVVADGFGAGGEVPLVAVLTCAAAVVALAVVESGRRRWDPPIVALRERSWSVGLLASLVMVAAVIAVLTQLHNDARSPHAPVLGSYNAAVRPFWTDPLQAPRLRPPALTHAQQVHHAPRAHHARHAHHAHHAQRSHHAQNPPPTSVVHQHLAVHRRHHHGFLWVWVLIILGLLFLVVGSVGARLLAVRRAWAQARRRLDTDPQQGVVGAWIWATLRFRAYRLPLPPQLSPDRVDRGTPIHAVPPNTAEPLRQLGRLVTPFAFGSPEVQVDDEVLETAWQLATAACAAAEQSLGGVGRLRVRFVAPPTAGLRSGN